MEAEGMKKSWVTMSFAMCLLLCSMLRPVSAQNGRTAEREAIRASEDWVALMDSGKYAESWKAAAAAFRSSVTQEKWESAMKTVRDPLGKLQTRKLDTAKYTAILPGVPNGDYVVLLFESSFEHKAVAQETVIMSQEKDKEWRVAGYYIK
jgi:hypothetical protein